MVELMISVTLGLFLISGAIGVFFSSKSSYNMNNEITWIQDNARFASNILKRDLRMAGFFGCSTELGLVSTMNNVAGGSGWFIDFENAVMGWDGDGASYPATEFPSAYNSNLAAGFPNSDIVTLRRGDDRDVKVNDNDPPTSATIDIDGRHPFVEGDILIISDCENTAVFQVTGNNNNKIVHNTGKGSPGNCTKLLGPLSCSRAKANKKVFRGSEGAFLLQIKSHAYYVDAGVGDVPTLYRRELYANSGNPDLRDEEIVQGVESLQVLYGLDMDGDSYPDRYVSAANVAGADWSNVMSVRLHLLFRSLNQVATQPQSFRFMGSTYTPSDRYLRQEMISSVDLRNRG